MLAGPDTGGQAGGARAQRAANLLRFGKISTGNINTDQCGGGCSAGRLDAECLAKTAASLSEQAALCVQPAGNLHQGSRSRRAGSDLLHMPQHGRCDVSIAIQLRESIEGHGRTRLKKHGLFVLQKRKAKLQPPGSNIAKNDSWLRGNWIRRLRAMREFYCFWRAALLGERLCIETEGLEVGRLFENDLGDGFLGSASIAGLELLLGQCLPSGKKPGIPLQRLIESGAGGGGISLTLVNQAKNVVGRRRLRREFNGVSRLSESGGQIVAHERQLCAERGTGCRIELRAVRAQLVFGVGESGLRVLAGSGVLLRILQERLDDPYIGLRRIGLSHLGVLGDFAEIREGRGSAAGSEIEIG
jgi:hypothetical protein